MGGSTRPERHLPLASRTSNSVSGPVRRRCPRRRQSWRRRRVETREDVARPGPTLVLFYTFLGPAPANGRRRSSTQDARLCQSPAPAAAAVAARQVLQVLPLLAPGDPAQRDGRKEQGPAPGRSLPRRRPAAHCVRGRRAPAVDQRAEARRAPQARQRGQGARRPRCSFFELGRPAAIARLARLDFHANAVALPGIHVFSGPAHVSGCFLGLPLPVSAHRPAAPAPCQPATAHPDIVLVRRCRLAPRAASQGPRAVVPALPASVPAARSLLVPVPRTPGAPSCRVRIHLAPAHHALEPKGHVSHLAHARGPCRQGLHFRPHSHVQYIYDDIASAGLPVHPGFSPALVPAPPVLPWPVQEHAVTLAHATASRGLPSVSRTPSEPEHDFPRPFPAPRAHTHRLGVSRKGIRAAAAPLRRRRLARGRGQTARAVQTRAHLGPRRRRGQFQRCGLWLCRPRRR